MKTSSQAVILLLLGNTKALDYTYPSASMTKEPTVTRESYIKLIPKDAYQVFATQSTSTATLPTLDQGASNVSPEGIGLLVAGDGCVQCIRSKDNSGVWCSAAWNFEYDVGNDYPIIGAASVGVTIIGGGYDKDLNDMGSCCYKQSDIVAWQQTTDNIDTAKDILNKWFCPAKIVTEANQTGQMSAITLVTTTPWWCSDGTYNMVADGAYGTLGAAVSSWKDAGVTENKIITNQSDRRFDLMVAQCRQKRDLCGNSKIDLSGGSTVTRAIAATFGPTEKCTFISSTKTGAPTFELDLGEKGFENKYDVHFQEWIEGWELTKDTDYIEHQVRTGAANDAGAGGTPFAHMVEANYGKAFKYNYADTIPGVGQEFGEVYHYLNPGDITSLYASNAVETSLTATDPRVKRWYPADIGMMASKTANNQFDDYAIDLANYKSKASDYNSYVESFNVEAEKDVFSAIFSPVRFPELVLRPNEPTRPADYTGIREWSTLKQQEYVENVATVVDGSDTLLKAPGAKEYVTQNNIQGGWGSWTMQRIVGLTSDANSKSNFPSHSFGLLGWFKKSAEFGATDQLSLSFLKNWDSKQNTPILEGTGTSDWQDDFANVMCQTADLTKPTWPCYQTSTKTDGSTNKSVKNISNVYLAITLWANTDSAGVFSTSQSLTINFQSSDWGKLKKNTQGPDSAGAVSPSLKAGVFAKSLIASSVAIFTVAMSLY